MTFSGDPTGLSHPGEPRFLVIGKLRRPHGLRGELLMEVITDFPERIQPGVIVYAGDAHQPLRVQKRRLHNDGLLIAFEGVMDSEKIQELRNCLVYVRIDDRPNLPQGDYYHHQILGLNVVDENGAPLGRVVEILETGANDVLVIAQEEKNGNFLLPYIDSVVRSIDLIGGRITVHLLPGIVSESQQNQAG